MLFLELKDDRAEKVKYDYSDYPIYIRRELLSSFSEYTAPAHWHDEIEFIAVLSGKMQYNINGKIITITENEGIIVNTRQMHFGFSPKKEECDFICILLHPLMLRERIDAAYEFLYENPETVCVLSGGQGSDEDISEAQCMFNELVAAGISPTRLYIEDRSTSTKENLNYTGKIIELCGLKKDIAVVTNEFHEFRAKMLAEELRLGFSAVSAKTAAWLFPTYLVREWYAIIYEVLFR